MHYPLLLLLWTAWCLHHRGMQVLVEGAHKRYSAWLTGLAWDHECLFYNPISWSQARPVPSPLMISTLHPQGSIQSFRVHLIIKRFFLVHEWRENSQNSVICAQASSALPHSPVLATPAFPLCSTLRSPAPLAVCFSLSLKCLSSLSY